MKEKTRDARPGGRDDSAPTFLIFIAYHQLKLIWLREAKYNGY
jgi:hypothetical protein